MSGSILFTHSYFYRFDPKQWKAKQPFPPYGTLYAAAVMRECGFGVSLFDTNLRKSPEEIIPLLETQKPAYLVLYDDGFNYLTKMCLTNMREAAFRMIKLGKQHGCIVIVSSSDSTDHFEDYLREGADFIILGEGEITLRELILALESDNDVTAVQGIAYCGLRITDCGLRIADYGLRIADYGLRIADYGLTQLLARYGTWGEVAMPRAGSIRNPQSVIRNPQSAIRNPPRPVLHDLDSLPDPAWDLVDMEAYRDIWMRHHGYFSLNLATTRGCPYKCNWCAKPIYGNRYNSRSPERVAAEIEMLIERYGARHFWMADDIFGLKPRWVQEFRDVVQAKDLKFTYKIQSRVDLLLKEDTIGALAASGLRQAWVGAESGSQKILDAMDKGTAVAEIREATRLLKQKGVEVCFFLQFGYLGETREDIEKTIALVEELLPHDIGVSVSYPLPGTKFYEKVKNLLGEKQNWTDSDDLAMMYPATYSPQFYRRLHRLVHKRFRLRQELRRLADGVTPAWRRIIRILYYAPAALLDTWRLKRLEKTPAR